jgi:hypothetical protein
MVKSLIVCEVQWDTSNALFLDQFNGEGSRLSQLLGIFEMK